MVLGEDSESLDSAVFRLPRRWSDKLMFIVFGLLLSYAVGAVLVPGFILLSMSVAFNMIAFPAHIFSGLPLPGIISPGFGGFLILSGLGGAGAVAVFLYRLMSCW